MSYFDDLKTLIDTDPQNATRQPADVLAWGNKTVTRIRASMSGDEVFQNTDATEFAGLTDAERALWVSFCGRDIIDPGAAANVAFLQYVFGAGSTTGSNLVSARQESVTRWTNAGLAQPTLGDIEVAVAP